VPDECFWLKPIYVDFIVRQSTTNLMYDKVLKLYSENYVKKATCFSPFGPSSGLTEHTILKALNGIPLRFDYARRVHTYIRFVVL
jgi:hypothetical protein